MVAAVYAYPWNFHDLDGAVSRVRAIGADEITLAASYHAGKFLQPGDVKARVYFPEDGTVYFRPRKAYGLVQPKMSALTTEHDILADLCARDDIAVNAWVVLNHNTRLGMLHPELTVRNAFGNGYPYSLCPSQAEVRAYAVTLCSDMVENYRLKSLLLETPGFLTYGHGFHHEFAQVEPNAWLDAMLGLCFCQSCRAGAEQAGIDASGLAHRICAAVDGWLAGAEASSLDHWNENDPDLAAYHRFRCQVVTSLVADIRAAVTPTVRVKVIATCQRPHATAYLEGHDLTLLDAVSDGLELPLYQSSPEAVLADGRYVLGRVPPSRTSVILRPGYPDMTRESDLTETLDGLEALGLSDFAFYNFGMLREMNLDWLKRALTKKVHYV
ncbi:hypothetical protein [Asticcacaulis sp. 201]|uniref:hypothetical protein n=1 Tax=Asticcacaulis sp. 201 TaxID=3028787 RepID=UPI002916A720|nr:hypothetical protein [Asticcacaulis sp. 201]MDV6330837.1 hypothetical protein [Asticcacaulis sp. 201]